MSSDQKSEQFIIYDGDCRFCTRSAHWFHQRLDADVEIAPGAETVLAALDVSPVDAARALQFVGRGQRASGAGAIAAWFSASKSKRWRFAGWFIDARLIRPFAAAAYWLVARNRGRLSWLFRSPADQGPST